MPGICMAFDGIHSHRHQHTPWLWYGHEHRQDPWQQLRLISSCSLVIFKSASPSCDNNVMTGVGQDSGHSFVLGGNMSIGSDSSSSMPTSHGLRQQPSTRHHPGPEWQAGHQHRSILHHAFSFRSASYHNKETILFFFLSHFSTTYLLIISCHVGVFHLLRIRQPC